MTTTNSPYTFEGYDAVGRAVRDFSRSRRAWRLLRESGLYVAVVLAALLLWSLADWALTLPPTVVLGSLAAAALVATVGLLYWLLRALLRRESRDWEAAHIEALHGELDNSVIGTLQLVEEARRRDHTLHSPALVSALAGRTASRLAAERLRRLIDRRPAARSAGVAAVLATIALVLVLGSSGFLAGRIDSVRNSYRTMLEMLWPVEMTVTPGDRTLLRHEDGVALGVTVTGGHYDRVTLTLTPAETDKRPVRTDLRLTGGPDARSAQVSLDPKAVADFQTHFTYRFAAGRHLSGPRTIRVVDRPVVENLSADVTFPAYTKMMPQQLTGLFGTIRALRGSMVALSLAANKPLRSGSLTFGGDEAAAGPLDINGRFAATHFVVAAPTEAQLSLVCEDGFSMKTPLRFRIAPVDDAPPLVRILGKKEEMLIGVGQARSLPVAYAAADDFGISKVQVFYEITTVDESLDRPKRTGSCKPLAFPRPPRKARGAIKAPFAELGLRPGDRVTFYLVATDNNTKTGPSRGQSAERTFVVVLPSLGDYMQPEFDWAARRSLLLAELEKARPETDYLQLPTKTVRAEKTPRPKAHKLSAHVPPEDWPAGVEQAVTDYIYLLGTQGAEETEE